MIFILALFLMNFSQASQTCRDAFIKGALIIQDHHYNFYGDTLHIYGEIGAGVPDEMIRYKVITILGVNHWLKSVKGQKSFELSVYFNSDGEYYVPVYETIMAQVTGSASRISTQENIDARTVHEYAHLLFKTAFDLRFSYLSSVIQKGLFEVSAPYQEYWADLIAVLDLRDLASLKDIYLRILGKVPRLEEGRSFENNFTEREVALLPASEIHPALALVRKFVGNQLKSSIDYITDADRDRVASHSLNCILDDLDWLEMQLSYVQDFAELKKITSFVGISRRLIACLSQ